MTGNFRRIVGGLPGFQNRPRIMQFPKTQSLDPKMITPQEASGTMRDSGVVGQTVNTFNSSSHEGPLSDEARLFVFGSPMRREPTIGFRVADNLGRALGEVMLPLSASEDFPIRDLIVNVGLILYDA